MRTRLSDMLRGALRRAGVRWPVTADARRELVALIGLAVLFLLFLIPALGYARREYRDGVRRALLRELKGALEQIINDGGTFPLHPSGDLGWCGSTDDPEDWFFVHVLELERGRTPPVRDPRPSSGRALQYCPTVLAPAAEGRPLSAAGFYLDAVLENRSADRAGFNTEHNVFERTVTVDGRTHYRICGGTEAQCGTRP